MLFDADVYAVLFRYYQAAHPAQPGTPGDDALRWYADYLLAEQAGTPLPA